VTDDAIDRINQMIVSGKLAPGERLPREADLASELGLSRNSLREAVRALAVMRVLDVRQGDGTYVTSLEPGLLLESTRFATNLLGGAAIQELFEVRRILESAAAARAAVRIDDAGLALLREQLDLMLSASTVEALAEADSEFHDLIARAAGNSVMTSFLDSLSSRTMRARLWQGFGHEDAFELTRADHVRIYEAIAARSPELASVMSAAHVARIEMRFVATDTTDD
jgi:DNA-binding FadR family transcriptional regulator